MTHANYQLGGNTFYTGPQMIAGGGGALKPKQSIPAVTGGGSLFGGLPHGNEDIDFLLNKESTE
jgi:hypothetical protein